MYIVYILLFLILLFILSIRYNMEHFELDDYTFVSQNNVPYYNNCIQLASQRGLIDTTSISEKTKDRLSILADMEPARLSQASSSSFISPNINSCILNQSTLQLYNSNSGKNKIDPDTCIMSGQTINNEIIYNTLTPIHGESPIYPKGCMLDLDNLQQDTLNEILDDAYQVKNYGFLKQRKDYEQSMVDLSEQNEKLKIRADLAEELNKQYSQQINTMQMNTDIKKTCQTRFTDWQDVGAWSYNYLDRHNVQCNDNEILSELGLQTSYNPNKARFRYKCCKLDSLPIPNRLKENKSSSGTPFQNSLQWNTLSMANHTLSCPGGNNENNSVLKGFRLEPQYINQLESNARFNTQCASFDTLNLPNKKVVTQCRTQRTPSSPGGPTFDVLNKHELSCEDGEGIVNAKLQMDGTNIYYNYACCKPMITDK